MKTSEYPTRYVASQNPRIIVLAKDPHRLAEPEAMVYHHPMQNAYYPNLEDGLEAMVSKRSDYWAIETNATRPNKMRTQRSWTTRAYSPQSALISLRRFIREAEHWIEQGEGLETPAPTDEPTAKEPRR